MEKVFTSILLTDQTGLTLFFSYEALDDLWADGAVVGNWSVFVENFEITKVVFAVGRSHVNWIGGSLN